MANRPTSTTLAPCRGVDDILGELFGGATQDPFPLYDELREQGDGIHRLELVSGYTVTRYSDVRLIGTDPATFSSDTFDLSAGIHDPSDAEHRRFIEISGQIFMFSDPPKHTRIRSALRHSFSPDVIERWRPVVERVTDELLARYVPGDEIDIMPGLAADVPVAVIAAILGVPKEKWPKFLVLPHVFIDRSLGAFQLPKLLRAAGIALTTMREHYGETRAQQITDHEWITLTGPTTLDLIDWANGDRKRGAWPGGADRRFIILMTGKLQRLVST